MRLVAPLLLLLAATLLAASLDRPLPTADLVFVNRGEVFTLDPQRMSYMQDFRLASALYEPLVRWNNEDFSIAPAAAERWTVSDDGRRYVFHLRSNARWSNGDPVTAGDFIYAWRRGMLPDSAADYAGHFFVIDGAAAFFQWRAAMLAGFPGSHDGESEAVRIAAARQLWDETEQRFRDTVGLRAPDDRTLEVVLARPTPYVLDLLAFSVFHPVHPPTVDAWVALNPDTGRLEQRHDWTKPPLLVGNGPYVLTRWRYKRGMRLELNPFYHSPQIVRSRTIDCVSIDDVNTAVLAFESGRIDWLGDVGAEYQPDMLAARRAYEARHAVELARLRGEGMSLDEALALLPPPDAAAGERRDIHAIPAFATDFYSFNCRATLADGRANPFADARVRRAFVMSVDKQAIVERVTRLSEPVMNSLIPPGSIPGYEPPTGLPHDPAAARTELSAAGWIDRDGDGLVENDRGELFPVVDLLWSTGLHRYKGISLVLKDMWQRELGVRIDVRGKETKFYKEDLKSGNFMIARGRWYGDYGDPTTFLDIHRTGDGNNDRGYSNPRFDALLDQAAGEQDPRRRFDLLREAERLIVQDDLPLLPLCQIVQVYMYRPGALRGLTHHPRLVQYLWELEADDGGADG